jgi:hypothetical protein
MALYLIQMLKERIAVTLVHFQIINQYYNLSFEESINGYTDLLFDLIKFPNHIFFGMIFKSSKFGDESSIFFLKAVFMMVYFLY